MQFTLPARAKRAGKPGRWSPAGEGKRPGAGIQGDSAMRHDDCGEVLIVNELSRVHRTFPRWLWPAAGALVCVAAGLISGLLSAGGDGAWYQALHKPPGTPPPAIFGPVWTVLYLLMGISVGLLINRQAWMAVRAFALQLALNLIWTPVFFGSHRVEAALGIICLLWGLILVTIQLARRVDGVAAWLLAPYGAWVSYATYLNAGIYVLNG